MVTIAPPFPLPPWQKITAQLPTDQCPYLIELMIAQGDPGAGQTAPRVSDRGAGIARAVASALAHHTADVNGVMLHWVTAGSGPPVYLLHGFPEFWYAWRHQIPALAAHYTVVART